MVNKNGNEVVCRFDALAKHLNGSFEVEKSVESVNDEINSAIQLNMKTGEVYMQPRKIDTIKYTTVFKSNKK